MLVLAVLTFVKNDSKSMDSTGGRHSGSYVLSGIKTGSITTQEIFSKQRFSHGDRACSHNLREDIPPCWKMWNTDMATQISREKCDVMSKRSLWFKMCIGFSRGRE